MCQVQIANRMKVQGKKETKTLLVSPHVLRGCNAQGSPQRLAFNHDPGVLLPFLPGAVEELPEI